MQHHHENKSVNAKVVPNEVLLNEGFPGFESRFLSSDILRGGHLHTPGKELRSSLYMSGVAAKKPIHFYFFLKLPVTVRFVSQVIDKHAGVEQRSSVGSASGRSPHGCLACPGCASGPGAFGIASSPRQPRSVPGT